MRTPTLGVLMLVMTSGLFAQVDAARDDFNFAAGLHDRGLHDRAVRAFGEYLQKWPKDSRVSKARFYLGESLVSLGRANEALPHLLKSAAKDHPLRTEARLRAGELLHRAGKNQEAIPLLAAVAGTEGAREELQEAALYFLAEASLGAGHRAKSKDAYALLLRLHPKGTYAMYAESALGFLEFEDGKHDDALARFLRVSRMANGGELTVEARVMVGECHLAREAPKDALRVFSNIDASEAGRFAPQVGLGMIRARLDLRELDAAIATYDGFRKAWPSDPRSHAAMIRSAAELHRAGRDEEGLKVVQAVKGATGKEAQDHAYWSGLLLTKTGRIDDAIGRLRRAVKQDPSPQRKFGLADALSQKGEFEEAAVLFAQVRKEAKDETIVAEAAFGEAFAKNRLKDHEGAVALLEKVRKGPGPAGLKADAVFALAENLFVLKRYKPARSHYASLLDLEDLPGGRRQACLYKIGWTDYLEKAHDRAISVLTVLLKDHPKSSFADEARYLVGKCHEAEGRDAEARAAFDQLSSGGSDKSLGVKALLGNAAAAHRSKDLEAAADAYTRAARGAQDDAARGDALCGLGDVLSDAGKHEAAEQAYGALLENLPEHPRAEAARLGRAWALRHLGRHEEAVKVVAPLVDSTKDSNRRGEALWLQALEESARPRWKAVVALLERFDQRCPDHPRGGEARLLLGVALARDGQNDRAEKVLGAIAGEGKDATGHASALYELAFLLEARDAKKERDQVLERVVREHPDCAFVPDVLFRLGESAYASGAWPEALERYRALAGLEDGASLRDKALYKAAWCLKRLEKPADSAVLFQKVAETQSPLAAESCFLAGEQHQTAGHHEDAARLFGRMAKSHRDHELWKEAALRRVLSLAALEQWEAVVADAPRALGVVSEGAWALRVRSALGDAFFARRAWDRCRTAYRVVTRVSEGEFAARAQYRIGLSFEKEGAKDKAIDELLKVTILFTHPEWVARATLRGGDLLAATGQQEKARKLYSDVVKNHEGTSQAKEAAEKLSAMQKGGEEQ